MKYLSRELNESDKVYYHQLKRFFNKATLIAKEIQQARQDIAKPYFIALQNQFPYEEINNLIQITDEDLLKNNKTYQGLTKILKGLTELAEKLENIFKQN